MFNFKKCNKPLLMGCFACASVFGFFYVTAVYLPEEYDDDDDVD